MLTFWDEFAGQARRTPDAHAVWSGRYYTYAETAEWAGRVSDRIRGAVPPGGLVTLMADDYASAVVGLLAAARAHCPVLRVNRQSPALYQAAITADARPWAILEEQAGSPDLRLTVAPGDGASPTRMPDAAYVIYTSGSTGRPKGVVVSHQPLLDRLRRLVRRPGFAGGGSRRRRRSPRARRCPEPGWRSSTRLVSPSKRPTGRASSSSTARGSPRPTWARRS